jgi:aminoglycoside phosphotransferase (APT) family kinase protein
VSSPTSETPTEHEAVAILESVTGLKVSAVQRFPTGLAHYVYDSTTTDHQHLVVRLTTVAGRIHFVSAVYWYNRLKPLGVPLPRLLYSNTEANPYGFPYMVIERLPGHDLGEVYPQLTQAQKRVLAQNISAIQQKVGTLPKASGFGYALSYEDPSLHPTWNAVLLDQLERARKRITTAGVFSTVEVEFVHSLLQSNAAYFDQIEPVAFLDDTTTKNVLIHGGRLSGIVDVDFVCFGDPLLTPALTQMALLSAGYDTDYLAYWIEVLNLTQPQLRALQIYTLLFCVGFMSELGHRFNQSQAPSVDLERVEQLGRIFALLKNGLF